MIRVCPDSRPARLLGAALAAVLAGSLSACAAGNNAVTAQLRAPGDGVATTVGSIRVLNALIVGPKDGSGVISMALANLGTQPETVSAVRVDRFGLATLSGEKVVQPGSTLTFGAGIAQAAANVPKFDAVAGETLAIDIEFERGAPVRGLRVPVQPATGYYSGLVATPSTTLQPTPSTTTITGTPSAPAGSGGARSSADVLDPQEPRQS